MSGFEALHSGRTWVLDEVCVMLAASPESILELVAYRRSVEAAHDLSAFDQQAVNWLRRGLALQHDLDIDALAASMLLDLLDENAALRRRVQLLERLAGLR